MEYKFDKQKFNNYYNQEDTYIVAKRLRDYLEKHHEVDDLTLSVFIGCNKRADLRNYVRNLVKPRRNFSIETAKLLGIILCDDESMFIC